MEKIYAEYALSLPRAWKMTQDSGGDCVQHEDTNDEGYDNDAFAARGTTQVRVLGFHHGKQVPTYARVHNPSTT